MANKLDNQLLDQIDNHLGSDDENTRWQAAILLGEYASSDPESIWPLVEKWGCSENEDLRTAIATCILEHLLEYHFNLVFPLVEKMALRNRFFADTFESCWKMGQSERKENDKRFEALKQRLRNHWSD